MALPTGTVTLLFSDLQGSTRLLLDLGVERYAEVLDAALDAQRASWREHGGHELGTEGDSCYVAFEAAEVAISAAVAAQRRLRTQPWPDSVEVAVRMGLHTGAPALYGGRYVGIDVHRAARIAGAAHGGQVLLSSATAGALVEGPDPGALPGVTVRPLGAHLLKDLTEPEELYELRADGLADGFPPVRSLGSVSQLPVTRGRLFGRRDDLDRLCSRLQDPGVRLVTLTGPGGSGKTRLAVELARALATDRGVHFVGLEHTHVPEQVWAAVGAALGVPAESRQPPALLERIADQEALLVLDNLEQVDGVGGVVARLLDAAPGIVVVATSRTRLRVAGEHEHPVPPLRLPGPADDALASPAVQLFLEEARVADPDLVLDREALANASEVCAALDGLPLAIELAAARVGTMPVDALLSRVRSVLDVPSRDSTRTTRHQTVRETVRWSYELLGEEQQRLFRLMGVFAGGARPAMVEDVARATGWQPDDSVLAELMDALAEAALVELAPDPGDELRVAMLNTVRAFAVEELRARGEDDVAIAGLAEVLQRRCELPRSESLVGHAAYLDGLEQELGNLRVALDWLTERARWSGLPSEVLDSRLRLGAILCAELGTNGGHFAETQAWGARLLEQGREAGPVARAELMCKVADLLRNLGRADEYIALVEEAAELVVDPAPEDLDRFAPASCSVRLGLGVVAMDRGENDAGREHFEHALVHAGDSAAHMWCLVDLGYLLGLMGEHEPALAVTEQGLAMAERIGDILGATGARHNRASILRQAGRPHDALAAFQSFVPTLLANRNPEWQAAGLEDIACVLVDLDRADDAALLFHRARALRASYASGPSQSQEAIVATSLQRAQQTLGPRWDELRLRAEGLTVAAALGEALGAA